jgi:hypothetical protein
MRKGRVIAVVSAAALACYGVMKMRKSRAARREMPDTMPAGRPAEAPTATVSGDTEEPKLASVRE